MQPEPGTQQFLSPLIRVRIWYVLILLCGGLMVIRLFYLQVIRHDHYQKAALQTQLKQYEIPAERGIIEAKNGNQTVPVVLNETRYTLFADPLHVTDHRVTAERIQSVVGGDSAEYEKKMLSTNTRYVVLAKKLDRAQKQHISELHLKGIGTVETSYRTYPQGSLAAQLLGFVNDDGEGKYGVEEALDHELKGVPGFMKAITDASGVPLAANKDNVVSEPRPGKRAVLTIDIGMQKRLEEALKQGLKNARSNSGSVVVLDANSGAIRAMANYPTYNPAEFFKIKDPRVFNNAVVSSPLEVGSIMKPLTAAAALDLGVVNRNTSYYDPGYFKIDNATIRNVEELAGAGHKTVEDILVRSLNTGATWLLMQMGGGDVNEQARVRWHSYMTNRYQFGKLTGVEQGYEAAGSVPDPKEGYGLNIQFANTVFGQGMSATTLQMAAALASVINGGTYYQPRLVEKIVANSGEGTVKEPIVVQKNVVSTEVGRTIREFMESAIPYNNMAAYREGYSIGGKTGTAQIARPEGGYYEDRYNGTYLGFVGGKRPEYVIAVRVNQPKIPGYAGSRAAGPIFADISNMLIDNFSIAPKN